MPMGDHSQTALEHCALKVTCAVRSHADETAQKLSKMMQLYWPVPILPSWVDHVR